MQNNVSFIGQFVGLGRPFQTDAPNGPVGLFLNRTLATKSLSYRNPGGVGKCFKFGSGTRINDASAGNQKRLFCLGKNLGHFDDFVGTRLWSTNLPVVFGKEAHGKIEGVRLDILGQ